ncbi:hypothetical protein OE88DRAFT_1655249 [Heliocybe sulcata]|uniref:Uncharacterized protein n=1 Tax=Heliocybe sulcata TaxID=5364 RepID=A0A5C3N9M8_9AGAM|nr:hypothetical protein OE88DRAFT_1655249 [Heliocybe sulcata]
MAQSTRSPFDVVHMNLLKIGAIPLEEFLASDNSGLQPIWDASSGVNKYLVSQGESNVTVPPDPGPSERGAERGQNPSHKRRAELSPDSGGGPIGQIADCCRDWRGGLVEPIWLRLDDPTQPKKYGYALQMKLSPECRRSYSVDTDYETAEAAQWSCATLAIDQGVLEFIKYGNGQTQPAPRPSTSDMPRVEEDRKTYSSLQEFFDSFSPNSITLPGGAKDLSHFNPSVWFHTVIPAAHARFQSRFIPIRRPGPHLSVLCGCVLRLTRPGAQPLTYIVEGRFKKSVVKAAVCLEAISQGLAEHLLSVTKEVDNKVTPEMRGLASQQILPALNIQLRKVPGAKMNFAYVLDLDGKTHLLHCILNVDLIFGYRRPWLHAVYHFLRHVRRPHVAGCSQVHSPA